MPGSGRQKSHGDFNAIAVAQTAVAPGGHHDQPPARRHQPADLRRRGRPGRRTRPFNRQADLGLSGREGPVRVTYPLQPGEGTPAKLVFTAFATAEGGGELTVGNRVTRQVTLALTSDLAFQPAGPPISNASVSPVLEKVTNNGNGTWTALWGWYSRNTVPVTIPIGVNNRFSPAPQARGQPVVFLPGRHYGQFSTATTSTLVWVLKGPDGQGRTATAGVG